MKPELWSLALKAQKNAHAPYSGKKIGAAVVMSNGLVFTGCNVENASYGGTVCAERVAIFKAISEGAQQVLEVVVVSSESHPWPPCGFCRQIIAEFGLPDTLIHLANPQGTYRTLRFADLFPEAFGPAHLGK